MNNKKLSRQRNIRSILLTTYFSALTVVGIAMIFYLVFVKAPEIDKSSNEQLSRNLITASSYIDSEVNTLSTVAENISYSSLVQDRFSLYLKDTTKSTDNLSDESVQAIQYNHLQNQKIMIDMLTAIIGPKQPVDQIYIHNTNYGNFGTGHYSYEDKLPADKNAPWYQAIVDQGYRKYLYRCEDDVLKKYYTHDKEAEFLSYCIPFYNKQHQLLGIIEVKNPMYDFWDNLHSIGNLFGEQLTIFNAHGDSIYAAKEDVSGLDLLYQQILRHGTSDIDQVLTFSLPDKQTVFYTVSSSSGCITAFTIDNAKLALPKRQYLASIVLVFLAFVAATFLISLAVANYMTIPIRKIMTRLPHFSEGMDEAIAPEDMMIGTNIIEFDTLYNSFLKTRLQMRESMQREIVLHNQEIQSRMLALQSQMNPHFLFNSLATIQSMADEEMYEEIIDMCQNMSRILRYISSDQQLLVPVESEVAHMCDYLNCMKVRYAGDFDYEVHIPDHMNGLLIPKLCLQMIAENSIKYASKTVIPPWYITITGTMKENHWEISIKDNGTGFSEEKLREIREKMQEIDRTDTLPSLEINGMGLLNIYIRLKLLYHNKHYMRIENTIYGGAMVTIGGSIDG